MPRLPIASLIWEAGTAKLRVGKNVETKRAAGKCITLWCRNRLPRSARLKFNMHCSKCMMRRWRANDPVHNVLAHLRERARRKRVPFDLTVSYLEWLLEGSLYMLERGRERGCLHIDRVKPADGYVIGNLRILDGIQNRVKGAKDSGEWVGGEEIEETPF